MGNRMNFDNVQVIGMQTTDGERFAAFATLPGTLEQTQEGVVRTGPAIDPRGKTLLESAGASAMQSEADLREKLAELGMRAETIEQKFNAARLWMTTVTITEPAC